MWDGRRWRVMLLAACIGAAAVTVPPMIVKESQQRPRSPITTSDLTEAAAPAAQGTIAPIDSRPSAVVTPVTVQAEDPGNRISPPAAIVACDTCDGGFRVRYIGGVTGGQVVVRATLPAAGLTRVTVVYESQGFRVFKISINGAPPILRNVSGPDWTTPSTFYFDTTLPAGTALLTFYNDESPAPDLDNVILG
jgi:hypothetical protein